MNSESKELIFKAKPLLALSLMALSYGLMGWYCAALDAFWNTSSWLLALALTMAFVWGWNTVLRVVMLTPRILVLILALSMTLTIAVSFSDLFVLMIMLIASTLFSRLELQTAGVHRIWTLVIISVIAGSMIGAGWSVGNSLYFEDLPNNITGRLSLGSDILQYKKLPKFGELSKSFL